MAAILVSSDNEALYVEVLNYAASKIDFCR